jgi:proteasome lid subunit RPN8/RPN11
MSNTELYQKGNIVESKPTIVNTSNFIEKSKYTLVIPNNVEQKIRFICKQCWTTEWSGVLFYEYTGNFIDDSFSIRCKDICVLDIGSAAFTSFTQDQRVISYMVEHDLLDCQMGLIHSHNLMATFFSGTDCSTLLEEGRDRNNFVSLIVNNQGVYSAAITRKVLTKNVCYTFFDQEPIEASTQKEEIQAFYLNIKIESDDFTDLFNTLKELEESKHKQIEVPPIVTNPFPNNIKQTLPVKQQTPVISQIPKPKKDKINILLNQIITGCIIAGNNPNLDIEKWIKKVPVMYSKQFPKFTDYILWIEFYVDYLLQEFCDDIELSEYAIELTELLAPYETSKYIKTITDTLKNYIL